MGIERYRAIVKLDEIRSLMEAGKYEAAKEVADGIRKERLKDSADLFLLAFVYRKNGEFTMAKEFLLRIYEKRVTWRVLEELMEVCLAQKNPEEAEGYLRQYAKISGGDPRGYIFEYRIGRQKHRPDEELLPILQTLKAEEYTEKYAYELAKLYHKLGRGQDCMAECNDLILWFGEGTYVERAKALQAYYRGELSVEDIQMEAERRIREAEERRAREEAEQKASEEEWRRLQEEQRAQEEEARRIAMEQYRMEEEEQNRLAEEERRAEEELQRFVEEEQQAAEKEPCRFEEIEAYDKEAAKALYVQETKSAEEEAAAADMSEPMWEPDATVEMEEEEMVAMAEETEEYEQMSLFEMEKQEELTNSIKEMAEENKTELQKSGGELTKLSPELAERLLAKGIVFDEALHEFARLESVRKQLIRMLEVVVTVRKKCHCLIITGEKQSGKTTLGTYLAKLLYELSYVKSPRVAKIGADRLNQMNLNEKKQQLQDCCLIVEGAGGMTEDTAASLLEFIMHTDVLGTVILEDNPNAMSRLLRNHAECNRMFNNRVHLPKYDGSDLMEFALGVAKQQDYEVTSEAKQMLWQKIEHLTRVGQKEGRLVATITLVKKAIEAADERNKATILTMAATGNFLAAGVMELTAEDVRAIR